MKRFFLFLALVCLSFTSVMAGEVLYGYTSDCSVYSDSTKSWISIGDDGYGIYVTMTDGFIFIGTPEYQEIGLYNVYDFHVATLDDGCCFVAEGVDQNAGHSEVTIINKEDNVVILYIKYPDIQYMYNIKIVRACNL